MDTNVSFKRMMVFIIAGLFVVSCIFVILIINSGAWAKFLSCYEMVCDRQAWRDLMKSSGWAAPLSFIALQIGQVVFAPIPGDVTGFLGGYLFGAWGGSLLSTIGLTIGSMLNFGIGHLLGERMVRRFVSCESYNKYNELVQYKGVLVIFIFFLLPVFPKDYLCLFLGLTTMPASVFFVISTIGRLPGTIALSLQGASIFDRNYMFFVIVTVLCVLFAVVAYGTREPLYRWMAKQRKGSSCPDFMQPEGKL
jgi:uncharacterized membrane protein YdjX (TVP38/TMEM64 family)